MRSPLLCLLPVLHLIGASAALAQPAPFSMSPGAPTRPDAPRQATPPVPAPAQTQAPPPSDTPAASPFSMTPQSAPSQRPAASVPAPAPATQPLPSATQQGAPATSPFSMTPGTRSVPQQPRPGASPTPPVQQPAQAAPTPARPVPTLAPAPPPASIAAAALAGRNERPILPESSIRLDGEIDARSWAISLTQDEAAGNVSLSVGYQNAVVVMPEVSRLRVTINGESAMDVPIASSQDVQRVVVPIRAGLLRPGQNIIRMEAAQRHRTDCTVRATYELWTEIDSATTSLLFANGTQRFLRGLEDLPAVGTDLSGTTTIRVIAPRVYRPEIRDRLLRLVQMVALRGRYAHPVIQVFETDPGAAPVGTLKVFLGVAGELRGLLPAIPDAANSQALAFVTQEGGVPSLIVSGPSWQDLDAAINVVAASLLNNRPAERNTVDTASWMWPDTQKYNGARTVSFGDMGVPTQEFSGRRFRVRFAIDLPADFYANYYGEATLYLDAGHTAAVRPGSHIDLYVNDKISSTMRITSRGEVFRRHPMRIPMRNFRPGLNFVSFEVVLLTDADERCPPGGTLSETSRFVLFDSSALSIPSFGRIGRMPDLSELSAAGYPLSATPATFVLARQNTALFSAAGTMLARLARDSGEPVRAQFANAAVLGDPSTFFIGAIDQLPSGMLTRIGVSERTKTVWQSAPAPTRSNGPTSSATFNNLDIANRATTNPSGMNTDEQIFVDQGAQASNDDIRRRWDDTLTRRSFLQTKIEAFKEWVEQTFSLSVSTLSLGGGKQGAFEPPPRSTLMLAQGNTESDGTWTILTARSEESLATETSRLTSLRIWPQVSGRIVTLDPDQDQLEVQPIGSFTFVQTEPFSLRNLRLVAANWMSINILQYAILLVACCTFLGAATYFLLKRLGRRS